MHVYISQWYVLRQCYQVVSVLQGSQVYARMKQLYKAFVAFSIDPVSVNPTLNYPLFILINASYRIMAATQAERRCCPLKEPVLFVRRRWVMQSCWRLVMWVFTPVYHQWYKWQYVKEVPYRVYRTAAIEVIGLCLPMFLFLWSNCSSMAIVSQY